MQWASGQWFSVSMVFSGDSVQCFDGVQWGQCSVGQCSVGTVARVDRTLCKAQWMKMALQANGCILKVL